VRETSKPVFHKHGLLRNSLHYKTEYSLLYLKIKRKLRNDHHCRLVWKFTVLFTPSQFDSTKHNLILLSSKWFGLVYLFILSVTHVTMATSIAEYNLYITTQLICTNVQYSTINNNKKFKNQLEDESLATNYSNLNYVFSLPSDRQTKITRPLSHILPL